MRIRHLTIDRFRGINHLEFSPGPRTLIIGPNNAGKSTILEALDLLLHHGIGRSRAAPTEIDYFSRNTEAEFAIEAVVGDLTPAFSAEVRAHLEGWRDEQEEVVAETDGEGIEPVVRVRARGTSDLDAVHEFAKPEAEGARFSPRLRIQLGWVFDGRIRDPAQQLGFYQGGLLERLFADADLQPAITSLRTALSGGADAVNEETAITAVLGELSDELRRLGLIADNEVPQFEVGAVSRRELLQALRLALPNVGVRVPLARQGRGAQRLVLVAILMRLAQAAGRIPIGGFEEPEEALEPLRQAQLARMLRSIVDRGGQIFVVTHSPEIARAFEIDDFVLLRERDTGEGARPLRRVLSAPVRQTYERWVDGSVVRGLFARIPLLVEGPGDRAAIEVFWRALEIAEGFPAAAQLGVDLVNCEGVPSMPMLAALLDEAGKAVSAWVDQDAPEVQITIERLRNERHCSALILHSATNGHQNLEEALATGSSLEALAAGMHAIAIDRHYTWEQQRIDLISRAQNVTPPQREAMNAAQSLVELISIPAPDVARSLISSALSARNVTPFEMKGGRQARLLAEKIVEREGVPANFSEALRELRAWIANGCARGFEFTMTIA